MLNNTIKRFISFIALFHNSVLKLIINILSDYLQILQIVHFTINIFEISGIILHNLTPTSHKNLN